MSHQSEQQLETNLIKRLQILGFEPVSIMTDELLQTNLWTQLEKFNQTKFSEAEWEKIYNYLLKGDRFAKAKTLRDRYELNRDNGELFYVRFFNTDRWCNNLYQVTHQVTQFGKYENRYDVTLLINGLPLVQIELKRRGVEMKEAFNQVQRYQRNSFAGTLFEYTQVFIISNGVNTKYFSNNPRQSFEQTFFWTNEKNEKITNLDQFADVFLEKCFISKMIAQYIVLSEAKKIPLILRPYQYYAVKAIEQRVAEGSKSGYIWHTTGSGKTLTSFKTSQVLAQSPEIIKIIFVVDRKDLDIQTTKEFNSFSDGSVDGTDNTYNLAKQLKDQKRKLIVTTVQKLDRAITQERYLQDLAYLSDQKVVIIFDECHRSQFGQTHARIKSFFKQAQLFGFTGTPIMAENNVGGVTTADVFDQCLHKYVITNAIADNNVLGFAVEYVGKYKKKEPDTLIAEEILPEIMVDGIDTKEILGSENRISKITDYVLVDWKRKTKNGKFNAILAVPNVATLKKYYRFLQTKKTDDFKVATIFTYQVNEDESNDLLDVDVLAMEEETKINQDSRDFLEQCIQDYNQLFATNYSTQTFYLYYKNLQERVKNKEIDLLLVVNMFLTGFDSPLLNTLYVDKNLRYHGLIQAFSRTNRLLNSDKPHGNIVCFRNLKEATDKALCLFGNENAKEIVIKKPYETQRAEFEHKIKELVNFVPNLTAIDQLKSEEEKAEFVKLFRNLLRLKSSLETFAEFSFADLPIDEQTFYDYQSKYLDLYEERIKNGQEKESILDEIDFELELTVTDLINYDYIIRLIIGLTGLTSEKLRQQKTNDLLKVLDRDIKLRKKKELIKEFIENNLPLGLEADQVENTFNKFWNQKKTENLTEIADKEKVEKKDLEFLVSSYLYTQKLPTEQEIADKLPKEVKFLQRVGMVKRLKKAIEKLVEIFEW